MKSERRRKSRDHGWSKKGTKASHSRARSRNNKTVSVTDSTPVPSSHPSISPPARESRIENVLPSSDTIKHYLSNNDFTDHSIRAPASVIKDVTDDSMGESMVRYARDLYVQPIDNSIRKDTYRLANRPSTPVSRFVDPDLRHLRAVYAYTEGLHTRLHYPQEFKEHLRGELPSGRVGGHLLSRRSWRQILHLDGVLLRMCLNTSEIEPLIRNLSVTMLIAYTSRAI